MFGQIMPKMIGHSLKIQYAWFGENISIAIPKLVLKTASEYSEDVAVESIDQARRHCQCNPALQEVKA